ncbi:SDR family NAD(P)-dependent oxidoreductase [Reichenbachiella carrageenanivorans]|uniref:SDR family NAD(P)-dependent oxidoreductase n=1 Tax=Reichenbachiella carrageenanivorans TaxID=2979869 RepID=A0ABY6CW07_9BACT|nr:SDR family NAD(P)-dependent oxidoreductase [Reichenbachiella carrageenanivorans]UXX78053.1 SDR family NAD(P)-dependent oxidoreductase [Reichenbachiella carrageenanivorans]
MLKYFENRNIWITGASSGIGEGLVRHLSQVKCNLIISARREEELVRVKNENQNAATIEVLPLDLADGPSLEAKTKAAEAFFGGVDILFNNGGISQRDKVIHTSMEVQRQIMEVNYFGTIALSKYVLPGMVKRKFGHHVTVTSAVGIISTPLRSGYSASKHAVHGFFDALRSEHFEDGIKVTLILPGYVNTQISYNALMGDGTQQNKLDKAQAAGLTVDQLVHKMLKKVAAQKEESYIGGFKEVMGIYMKRFFPSIFSILVRKMAVT